MPRPSKASSPPRRGPPSSCGECGPPEGSVRYGPLRGGLHDGAQCENPYPYDASGLSRVLEAEVEEEGRPGGHRFRCGGGGVGRGDRRGRGTWGDRVGGRGQERRQGRSEEHTSELQSRGHLVCRLLLEKKKE